MRVLLKNNETKRYYRGPREWSEDAAQAFDFEQIDIAAQVYHNENLSFAEIVLDAPPANVGSDRPNSVG
jgi:hypothetical protein